MRILHTLKKLLIAGLARVPLLRKAPEEEEEDVFPALGQNTGAKKPNTREKIPLASVYGRMAH